MPPSMPPTQTVLPVASEISTHIARTLPEATPLAARVLPLLGPTASVYGPLSVQVKGVEVEVELAAFSMVVRIVLPRLS